MISIIIPTYNRANTLSRSIRSVLGQTSDNWELIIIDDGSTDHTTEVVKKFQPRKRIRYYFQENSGVSVARNYGMRLSKGDYLIFLDSDDRLYPKLISDLLANNYYDYDLICWQVCKVKQDKEIEIWKPKKLEKIYNNITASFLAGSICYRKEIVLAAGGYDSEMYFGENYELGLRIAQMAGLRLKILSEVYLDYFLTSEVRDSDNLEAKLKSNQHLYRKHRKLYADDYLSHARLNYLMGYLNQKQGYKARAFEYYKRAWRINPLYIKAFLKVGYLQLSTLLR